MRAPIVYRPETIKKWDVDAEVSDGSWALARPLGLNTFMITHRIKLAWYVFIGKYDVLKWGGK